MNILTFDVEEWFHLLDFDATRSVEQWKKYPVRIYDNVDRILNILEQTNTKATFFVIGWIAKTYPDLVKKIAEKYEIGSHTLNHQLVWQQKPQEFKEDVSCSIKLLEDITGKKVKYFRAPGFSVRQTEGWAFDIIKECGIEIDCSVFPVHHAHGGIPHYGKAVPSIIEHNGTEIKEMPISTKNILHKHIIFSGGGYFRLCPYWLIKRWTKELQNDYLLSYIHPRDLDAGQPMLQGLPLTRKFKSYIGLKTSEKKLTRWLTDFNFTDIASADKQIDWHTAPKVKV